MGQKLRLGLHTFFLAVSLLLMWGGRNVSVAQVSIESDLPLEVRFTQGESNRNETSLTIGLSDIQSLFSSEFTLSQNQWQSFDQSVNNNSNYFLSENSASVAPGRVQVEGVSYQTFFLSSFQNNTGHSIGNLVVAYDFLYNFFQQQYVPGLELKYKVNDGEWKNVASGRIRSSALRSTENDWSSLSINLNVDDIFLRPSDTIHLMWILDESVTVSKTIPLALQRMEIFPQKTNQTSLTKGDLIITEILPNSNVNGSAFEYVELYNPGESTVSLKGLELHTPSGSKVIQKDLYVEPYDFAIISNVDISSLESVRTSYFYSGSVIDEDGGRVELERDGNLIASATYEKSESGVAIELNRVSRAYDGYSSLQDFEPAHETYFQDLYGSPGISGDTRPMLTKKLSQHGLYVITFPGNPIPRLNRHSSLEYFMLDGTPISLEAIEANQTVLVQKEGNEPVTLFAETEIGKAVTNNFSTRITSHSTFYPTTVYTGVQAGANQAKTGGGKAVPITQTWNPRLQKFDLELVNRNQQEYWNPSVIQSSIVNLLEVSENRISSPVLDRFIDFTLVPENENGSSKADQVILGFMDSPSQYNDLRYDLPKLTLTQSANRNTSDKSLLYLTSTLSDENYNSFTHLPFDISQEYDVGLGLDTEDAAGTVTLKWKVVDSIPEEWVISLEDTYTGATLNLREEDEYRFRYNNSSDIEQNEDVNTPAISSISPSGRPRFIIKVQPFESFAEINEETETPESIELQPNYPNPFNPSTNINFFLPEERNVKVGIYNIVGQQVALLLDDTVQQGEHSLVWDASGKPSGIYIVQLETGNQIFTRKITLIK